MREEWTEARIDELGNGLRPVLKAGPFGSSVTKAIYQASGYKVYGQQEVVAKDFNAEAYFVSEATFRRHKGCVVKPGDLLMTMMGTIGRVYRVPEGAPEGIINPRLVRIAFDTSRILPEYAEAALEQPPLQRLLDRRSHGGTMQGLNLNALASIRLPLPPLPEQCKIAAVLQTWDTAIQKAEQLIAAKERYKKALMQRVFETGSYPPCRLSEFTRRVTRKNVEGDGHPLTISGAEGLVSQSRYFGKRIAAEKTEHYTLLKRGEYAYNKSYSAGYPLGAIKRLDAHDEGIVSTLYLCFALDEGKAPISDYFAYFCEAGGFNHQIYQVAQEGARNHGLLNVTADDFFSMTMPIPPSDVQERVVKVLGTAMRELALLREQLTALRSQKRGLMQKLLTGRWRLPITLHTEEAING